MRNKYYSKFSDSLSVKFSLLTIFAVFTAILLVFFSAISNFKNMWLSEHVETMEIATILYFDDSNRILSEKTQADLLNTTHSAGILIRKGSIHTIIAGDLAPTDFGYSIDMQKSSTLDFLLIALKTMMKYNDDYIRVLTYMKSHDVQIEFFLKQPHLRASLLSFAFDILIVSLMGMVMFLLMVFISLHFLLVRPMRHMAKNLITFSKSPEDNSLIIKPTSRADEIGVMVQNLSKFQSEVQMALHRKERLANLGLAVAKINHDMRNILSSAQLFFDRLYVVQDPVVQNLVPKLLKIIDRAVKYTRAVISYGKAMETLPNQRPNNLKKAVTEVFDLLDIQYSNKIDWQNRVPEDLIINFDPEQLFRILFNLCQNSVQAIEESNKVGHQDGTIKVEAKKNKSSTAIFISDNGPGIPKKFHNSLFKAFVGTIKSNGTGLGLAIVAEFVRANGATIKLETKVKTGTCFIINIPDLAS